VIGGLGEDEGNTIVGGGDPLSGEFRDGILATGTLTGSSITGTDITDTATGVWFQNAQGIDVNNTLVSGSEFFGFRADGVLTGSKFRDNLITNTSGIGGGLGHGMYLNNATNLEVYNNIGEDSFGSGLYVTGDTTGTTVTNNLFDGNRIGITLDNATNAVIGGLGEDEGNTIIGGGDSLSGEYRDGILATGTLTGSSITGTDISDTATGVWLRDAQGVDVNNTLVSGSEFFGFRADGVLTGSKFRDNDVVNTVGIGGGLGHGMYLNNATNLELHDNLGEDSFGSGLYITGDTSGTTVRGNLFDDNRVGITLDNATNAVIGGNVVGEDNRIIGGGDASLDIFRDGIVAIGISTGSSITKTTITNTATGIALRAATGLFITSATVTGSQVWGLNASGECVSAVISSTFTLTTGGAGGGAGVLLSGVQSFLIQSATISNNVIGLLATGNCTATRVIDTTWSGNTTGVINNSTGIPALDIDPPPPAS